VNDLRGDNYFYNSAIGYDGRNISAYTNLAGIGNNYITDIGLIPRSFHYDAVQDTSYRIGFDHWFTRFAYTLYPESGAKVNTHEIGMRNMFDGTADGRLINNELEINYMITWRNSSSIEIKLANRDIQLLYPFAFTDFEPLPTGKYHFNFLGVEYQSDQRRPLSYKTGFETGQFYNGKRHQFLINLNYRAQPWGNFGLNFVQNELDFPDPYGSQSLSLLGPKIELAFSTDLFWTTFIQYNTQEDNFNINSRLQWRFQPLSDIYLVYTDNYAVEFWGPKNRVFVLKMNYWLNI
jgi:hypothetical protein